MVRLYLVKLYFFFTYRYISKVGTNESNYKYSLSVLLKNPSWRSRTNNSPSLSNLLDGCCASVIISCLLKRISFVGSKNKVYVKCCAWKSYLNIYRLTSLPGIVYVENTIVNHVCHVFTYFWPVSVKIEDLCSWLKRFAKCSSHG